MRDFLTLAELLVIHADQNEPHGGTHGVGDPGVLKGALYRPKLQINGAQLTADADDAYEFVSDLYETGTLRIDKLAPWLRRRVRTPTT